MNLSYQMQPFPIPARLGDTRKRYATTLKNFETSQTGTPFDCINFIVLLDPCMGSGHILVYAFDVLVQIYKDAGYREKDIPELILKHNLYGLDIDDRAYQLAYFAVMMRAWNYNHRILVKRIEPNLCAIQESNGLGKWSELNMDMSGTQQLNLESQFVQLADELIEKFQDAKEYGSILDVEEKNYGALLTYIKELQENSVLDLSMAAWLHEVGERLPGLVKQAQIMGQKYDIVVTNNPSKKDGSNWSHHSSVCCASLYHIRRAC